MTKGTWRARPVIIVAAVLIATVTVGLAAAAYAQAETPSQGEQEEPDEPQAQATPQEQATPKKPAAAVADEDSLATGDPSDPDEPAPAELAPEALDRAAMTRLADELIRVREDLLMRQAELDELMRSEEVLRRAGVDPEPAVEDVAPEPVEEPITNEEFQRLVRAYENMEAESAARALVELAARDRRPVVELLSGWKPRTSGAVLDAMTQIDAGLAADLSFEIWQRRHD